MADFGSGSNGVTLAKFNGAITKLAKRTGRKPTSFQHDIFKHLVFGNGHTVVNAVAGSGKSTTLEDACWILSELLGYVRILMCAFNSDIVKELSSRITAQNVKIQTLNSLGMGILYKNLRHAPTLEKTKTRLIFKGIVGYDQLNDDDRTYFDMFESPIDRIVGLMKGIGYGAIRDHATESEIWELCDRFDIDIDEEVDLSKLYEILMKTYENSLENTRIIDFNDQLILPFYHRMPFPSYYDHMFIDEAQDLNPIQQEIVKRVVGRRARATFVGDRNQAIYGFRGADPDSIINIIETFKSTELPLSICWRCPTSVIEGAQKYVPEIQAAPNAKPGKVESIKEHDMIDRLNDGDLVLCRTTAPMAESCMDVIRAGKKATIKGGQIGEGLSSLASKIARKKLAGSLIDQFKAYASIECEKLVNAGKDTKADGLKDRIDTLVVLAEDADTLPKLKSKIKRIFSDKTAGIVFSTIHKAKGLEAKHVYVIHPELMPHPMAKREWSYKQEINLIYIANTRSTESLTWVTPEKPIRFGRKFDN